MYAGKAVERQNTRPLSIRVSGGLGVLAVSLAAFLLLGAYQLDLPGLQYDEAKEAGLNAMQLVLGQPVTAFRDATVQIGPWHLPLMVQDYIGGLNVVLATPFLAIGGVNVVALRWLPLLTGALTLWLAWLLARRLGGPLAAGATAILLACSPAFLFWSRQGIFVTNLTACLFLASLLLALRWWVERQPWQLWLLALLWGFGVYAKLLFVWAIGAILVVGIVTWLMSRRRPVDRGVRQGRSIGGGAWSPAADRQPGSVQGQRAGHQGSSSGRTWPVSLRPWSVWLIAALLFLLPLLPLLLFNLRTGGTLTSVFGNLGHSYYGVDNRAYWPNLLARIAQLRILLQGDHLWYLGEVYANRLAPWLALGLIVLAILLGLIRRRPGSLAVGLPIVLVALVVAQSAFTVSDLFITHYAMLLPLIPVAAGVAIATIWRLGRGLPQPAARRALPAIAGLALLLWSGTDAWNTIHYHRILTASGGYGSHSDAIYRLAGYLAQHEPAAPLALDWGMDAQLRFLTRGQVNPVEVFGYSPLDRPDAGFADRVTPFLADPNTLYIAHVPQETVFHGRVETLRDLAASHGLALHEEARFGLRSGHSLFVVYRVGPG